MTIDLQLIDALDSLTREQAQGISEWALIQTLDQDSSVAFEKPDMADSWALFQQHFLLFHHLYLLKLQLEETGETLDIVATRIKRHSMITDSAGEVSPSTERRVQHADPMQSYYLDLDNLEKETPEGLKGKLDAFWRGLIDPQLQTEDWKTLDLQPPVSATVLRQQYRRQCQRHHPDRGGSARRFQAIQAAYARLKSIVH